MLHEQRSWDLIPCSAAGVREEKGTRSLIERETSELSELLFHSMGRSRMFRTLDISWLSGAKAGTSEFAEIGKCHNRPSNSEMQRILFSNFVPWNAQLRLSRSVLQGARMNEIIVQPATCLSVLQVE